MCMLTFLSPDAYPDVEALTNGAEMNDDGHGFAIVTKHARNPIVRRYMSSKVAIEEFDRLRAQYPDGPALFHSRWGTGGEVTTRNAHPFRVDRQTVLAHNGVLPRAMQPGKGDWRCDTRLFAEDMLKGEDLSDTKVRNQIAYVIGKSNKLVILSTRLDYKSFYIVNEDQGHWVDGVWYSNLDFTGYWNRRIASTNPLLQGDGWEGDKYVMGSPVVPECHYCSTDDVDDVTGVCLTCDLCQDCGQDFFRACMCYTAARRSVLDGGVGL